MTEPRKVVNIYDLDKSRSILRDKSVVEINGPYGIHQLYFHIVNIGGSLEYLLMQPGWVVDIGDAKGDD